MADKTLKVYLFSSILNMLNQNGKTNLNKGYVTQIIGPVLDIKFSEGNLPPIVQQNSVRRWHGNYCCTTIIR
jgi:hypothetical protein